MRKNVVNELSKLFDFIEYGIILLDEAKKIIYTNETVHKALNLKEKQINVETIEQIINNQEIVEIIKNENIEEPLKIKKLSINKNENEKINVDVNLIPFYCEEEKYSCLFIKENYYLTGTNNKDGYKALLKALPDLLFIIDKKGNFLDVFAQNENDLLLKKEEIIKTNIQNTLPPDLLPIHQDNINKAFKTKKLQSFNYSLQMNNETKYFEARMIAIDDNKLFSLIRNITEREKYKLDLEYQNDIYHKAEEIGDFGSFVINLKEKTIWLSKGIQQHFNFLENKIEYKKDFSNLNVHPDDLPKLKQQFQYLLQQKNKIQLELRILIEKKVSYFLAVLEYTKEKQILGFLQQINKRKNYEKSLLENEEKYKTLAFNLPEIITRVNKNKEIVFISPSAEAIFGVSSDKIIGKKIDSFFFNKETIERWITALKSIEETGKKYFYIGEQEIHGKQMWFEHQVLPEYNHQGEIISYLSVVRDITESKQAENALKESQRKMTNLISNMQGLVYSCLNDENWTMQYISEGCFEITGYKPNELLNNKVRSYNQLIHSEDVDYVRETIQDAVESKKNYTLEYRIIDKKRKEKWVWEKGQGVFDNNGELLVLEGIINDVTERKYAEKALEKSKKDFENLADYSPAAIIIRDETKAYYANKTAIKTLGVTKEELLDMNIVNTLVLPEYQSIIKERSNKVFQNEEVPFIDIKIRRPFDGKIIDIETKLSKISYQGKDLLQVVFRDISLQRKVLKMQLRAELAEESNLKLQEEIIKRKKTEKELIKSLEEKDILLKEVHHRVKNNMQIISSILNLQCNRMEKGEAKEILTNSRDRIRSMSLVHENLYRRKDFDKIDFKEYIDSMVSNLIMTYNINPQEIKIKKNIEKTIVSLEKCISLGLIINEIITNAIKHAFTEKLPGEIFLQLNTNTDKITSLLIKDNGKGIPDIKKMKKNIGFEIIESLSKQIDAELIIRSENGLSIEMKIPNLAYLNEY